MLTTAKSIQLLDVSGMNISPITDITSLYYEVQHNDNPEIIVRKYVYDGFPVNVNIDPSNNASIGISSTVRQYDYKLYDNGNFYKFVNNDTNSDILVSNVSTNIIPGTTYRQINVTNYNLSEILTYYTPLDLMDASIDNINSSINIINTSINELDQRISDISLGLHTESGTLNEILTIGNNNNFVPNKFYIVNNYFYGFPIGDYCMNVPTNHNNMTYGGPDENNKKLLLVKANDPSTLDGKLYGMYTSIGEPLNVYGTYEITEYKQLRITYLKDKYGNEAPYDFYNLKCNGNTTFNIAALRNGKIQNNIIKTNPYKNDQCYIIIRIITRQGIIKNNYIGSDNIIDISIYNSMLCNNIGNNNTILHQSKIKLNYSSIGNSNNIKFNTSCDINSLNIDNNNIINFEKNQSNTSSYINSLIINSSNNINLYITNTSCGIILNDCSCDASICLNNTTNFIIDNYISNTSLNVSSNCAYMFGQNIYAKSFNTLRNEKL